MTQILKGNIIHAPQMGRLDMLEHGCLVLEDGVITAVSDRVPEGLEHAVNPEVCFNPSSHQG